MPTGRTPSAAADHLRRLARAGRCRSVDFKEVYWAAVGDRAAGALTAEATDRILGALGRWLGAAPGWPKPVEPAEVQELLAAIAPRPAKAKRRPRGGA